MKPPIGPPRLVDGEGPLADLLRDASRAQFTALDVDRAWQRHQARAARPVRRLFVVPGIAFALGAAALLVSSHVRRADDASAQAEPEPALSLRRPEPVSSAPSPARLLPAVAKPTLEAQRLRAQPALAVSEARPLSSAVVSASASPLNGPQPTEPTLNCLAYARAGDAQQAEQCFEQQAQRNNLSAEVALYELARLRRDMLGKPALALLALDEYGRRFPHGYLSREVSFSRLELLQKLGRSDEVLRASAELLASPSGTERAPEIHFVRGNVYASSDAAAAAREYALASVAPGRIGDDAAFLEALNLEKAHNQVQARAAFERYLARSGGRHVSEAKTHLEALSPAQASEPH